MVTRRLLVCNRLQNKPAESVAGSAETAPSAAGAADYTLSGRRAALALLGLAACATCFLTAENLPIGLLPQISASMHTSLSTTGLLVTIYALLVVTATVPLARFTRRVPRRYLLAAVAAALAIGSVGSAAAPSFGALIAARIFTATAQAIFWAVGPTEAANLIRPERRAQAVTAVFTGSALGLMIGVPAGTAIGHAAGWRVAFVTLAGVALVLLVTILVALPSRPPLLDHADRRGSADRARYRVLIAFTALAVTANFAWYTYASAFLVKVSGLPKGSVALVLFAAGIASAVGLSGGSPLYLRHRRATIPLAVSFALASLVCLFAFARVTLLAAVFIALASLGQSAFTVAGSTAVIELKPSDGSAWYSTAYNIGIATGPLAGALTLHEWGLRAAPLAGVVIAAAAVTLMVGAELRLRNHPH
jgi:predicted MFS family arabinose efflux permease